MKRYIIPSPVAIPGGGLKNLSHLRNYINKKPADFKRPVKIIN